MIRFWPLAGAHPATGNARGATARYRQLSNAQRVPLLALTTGVVMLALPCAGQTFQTIYQFGAYPDAQTPLGLVAGANGTLRGAAATGGFYGYGAVFELRPPSGSGAWTDEVLYSFAPQNGDVSNPTLAAVAGPNDSLYGVTASTFGAVFQLQPPTIRGGTWTETVLLRGIGSPVQGLGNVVVGQHGEVYGVADYSGDSQGAIYGLTPPALPGEAWNVNVLYSFTGGADGSGPSGLALGANRVLYGVATYGTGRPSGTGNVFALTPTTAGAPWTLKVLYTFPGGAGGANPVQPPIIGSDGSIYGTTSAGGTDDLGFVFQISPPGKHNGDWTETVLYNFTNAAAGTPSSPLALRDGNLYGTTANYSLTTPGGSVFELQRPTSPGGPWTETTLYQFTSKPMPSGSLVVLPGGTLCGTTNAGDILYVPGAGTAYCITGIPGGSK